MKIIAILSQVSYETKSVVVEVPDDYDSWSDTQQRRLLNNIDAEAEDKPWVTTDIESGKNSYYIAGPSDYRQAEFKADDIQTVVAL